MSTAYLGGYIGDKYEDKFPATKALLDAICWLIAFPFVFFSYTVS